MEILDEREINKKHLNKPRIIYALKVLGVISLWVGLTIGSIWLYNYLNPYDPKRGGYLDLTPLGFLFGYPILAFFIGIALFALSGKRDPFSAGTLLFALLYLLIGAGMCAL